MTPARLRAASAALALAALALPLAARAATYQFNDFESPDANGLIGTTVNGISNAGNLVGFAGPNNTNFVLAPGGGFTMPSGFGTFALANGINSAGTIVGMDLDPNGTQEAFVLPSGAASETILPPPAAGASGESAFGINDGGVIVGQYSDAAGDTPGFIDNGGTFTTINAPAADAALGFTTVNVQGINNNGLAVGFFSDPATGVSHGFTYNYTTSLFTTLADPDPGDPNFLFSQVLGVNDSGIAAGYFGTTTNLQHGFLYDTNTGTYTYLDDSNVALGGSAIMQITGINNSGEISGFYSDAGGYYHGFSGTPDVPEPAPLALFGLGLLPVGLLARKRFRTA